MRIKSACDDFLISQYQIVLIYSHQFRRGLQNGIFHRFQDILRIIQLQRIGRTSVGLSNFCLKQSTAFHLVLHKVAEHLVSVDKQEEICWRYRLNDNSRVLKLERDYSWPISLYGRRLLQKSCWLVDYRCGSNRKIYILAANLFLSNVNRLYFERLMVSWDADIRALLNTGDWFPADIQS